MNLKLFSAICLMVPAMASAQGYVTQDSKVVNDSNTPLHLLKPDYKHGYGVSTKQEVKSAMDKVMNYILANPTQFRTTSYEWGVTYSACLDAAKASGDAKYSDYVEANFRAIADAFPGAMKDLKNGKKLETAIRKVVDPHALDDAGAICAAMIKADLDARKVSEPSAKVKVKSKAKSKENGKTAFNTAPVIANYAQYIMEKEFRLEDGTFARKRPHKNTVWLDDMFMAIPAVAYMGAYTGDSKYYDEAARQVLLFRDKMWVKEKKLFRHGWVEAMTPHPAFHWGRANGWAILTMCEVLDVLPESHPQRPAILDLLRQHIEGLAALQTQDGFWHQLLDRNDSYEESSCTAIYTYCIAHAINKGWVSALAYGPMVQLAWHAVAASIDDAGRVTGTCVGTGMGFDPAFYMYRPVSTAAAHGYGPVIWAGAEMLRLIDNQHPKMNDSAVQFYPEEVPTDEPIFNYDGEIRF